MDHNDIRHKLSDYLDGSVAPAEISEIEEHLQACRTCSDALHELQKTVEHIKSVEEVEPPTWMTQKIMANVRAAEEEREGLFRRLFHPLSVKLPIQAVAVLFLAVTAYYIYQNMHPTAKYAEAPLERFEAGKETPSTPAPETEQKIRRDSVTPAKKTPQAPGYKALDMKQEYEKPAPPIALGKASESAPAAAEPLEQIQKKDEGRSDVKPQESHPSDYKRAAPAMGLTAGGEPRSEGAPLVAKRKAALTEESAKNVFDLIMKVNDFDTAQKEIEKTVTVFGGKIIRTAPSADKSEIIVSINKDKVAELLVKLKTIGDVKEQVPTQVGSEGYLTIRITMTRNW
jgi:predicted integral membrane protein DUF2275/putative zinc finger protein